METAVKAKTVLAWAVALMWVGCAAPPERADAPSDATPPDAVEASASCERPTKALSAGASLVGMGGEYTLTMVAASGEGASASGSLTLIEQEAGLEQWGQVATPLFGSSDINLDAVGAVRVGELDIADAASPGVIVMEDEGPDGPRIRLRLGSRANTRETAAFDGGYTILTVAELVTDGFAGEWRSAAGGPVTEGWFCVTP